jgi:tetratricopeptide (TPR) repeat protein
MKGFAIGAIALLILAGCASQYITSGKIYMQQQNWDKAIEQFQEEVKANPQNGEAYIWLGKAYAGAREYEKASDAFTKGASLGEKTKKILKDEALFVWGVYNAAGTKAVKREDYKKAEGYFNTAIQYEPDSASTYSLLGFVYTKLGDSTKVVSNYKLAIEKNPKDIEARKNLVSFYMNKKDYNKAIELLREAGKIDTTNSDIFYYIGVCESYKANLKKAEDAFRKVISIDSTNEDAYFNLGMTLIKGKNYQGAIETLKEAVKINPEDSEAWSFLGSIYLTKKRYQESVDAYTRAIELQPDNANFYHNRASAYFGLNESAKAKADKNKAGELEKK